MKLHVKVRSGGNISERLFEVPVNAEKLSGAGRLECFVDGKALQVDWADMGQGRYSIIVGGRAYALRARKEAEDPNGSYWVSMKGQVFQVELVDPRNHRREKFAADEGPQEALAPMPGRIVKLLVAEGSHVNRGEGLLVIEAMKMQNEVRAARAGVVEKIHVAEGDGVEAGSRLVRLA
jgi:biotin carboxyl carrier protein